MTVSSHTPQLEMEVRWIANCWYANECMCCWFMLSVVGSLPPPPPHQVVKQPQGVTRNSWLSHFSGTVFRGHLHDFRHQSKLPYFWEFCFSRYPMKNLELNMGGGSNCATALCTAEENFVTVFACTREREGGPKVGITFPGACCFDSWWFCLAQRKMTFVKPPQNALKSNLSLICENGHIPRDLWPFKSRPTAADVT